MKVLNPRTISVSMAAVALAFVSGVALASHQQPASSLSPAYKAASSVSSSTDTASSIPSIPASPITAPDSAQNPASTSPSTNTATSTTTTQTTAQSGTAPTVTAVTADIQPWTDPAATTPQGGLPGSTTTVSYQYCLYTYSDGSTQQTIQRTKYQTTNPDGSAGGAVTLIGGVDCTVNNAPAPR